MELCIQICTIMQNSASAHADLYNEKIHIRMQMKNADFNMTYNGPHILKVIFHILSLVFVSFCITPYNCADEHVDLYTNIHIIVWIWMQVITL